VPQARLAAGRVLAGHQPDPGRELPAVLEFASVAHGGDDRKSGGGADAADLHQALRGLRQTRSGLDLPVVAADPVTQHAQLLEQIASASLPSFLPLFL